MKKCNLKKAIKFYDYKNKVNKRELAIGKRIEMEHTRNKKIARAIAIAHIKEYPHYYTKGLIPMEKRLKKRK